MLHEFIVGSDENQNGGNTMSELEKPVRTLALFSRKEGMSFAQFDAYWRDVHAPLAAQLPGVTKYVQRHVVPSSPDGEPDNGFGVDGIAQLEYESMEAMEAAWAGEEGQKALADVPNFIGKHFVLILEDYVVVDNEEGTK